jgi:hypothetical protein
MLHYYNNKHASVRGCARSSDTELERLLMTEINMSLIQKTRAAPEEQQRPPWFSVRFQSI